MNITWEWVLLIFWLKFSELKKPSAPSAPSAPSTHIPRWHGPYRGHSNHSIQAQQLWCSKIGLLLFGLVHIVSEVVCATKCFINVNTQFYMCFVWMEWNGMECLSKSVLEWVCFIPKKLHAQLFTLATCVHEWLPFWFQHFSFTQEGKV